MAWPAPTSFDSATGCQNMRSRRPMSVSRVVCVSSLSCSARLGAGTGAFIGRHVMTWMGCGK
jgi:hypothetical protein